MTDFETLLGMLVRHDVAFIIVGGAAAIVHGSSRLTQDLDIVYQRTPENLARLVAALAEQSPYPRDAPPGLPFRWTDATLRMGLNFTLDTRLGQIDDLIDHTIKVEVFGVQCRTLDLPALIQVKRAAGRPKDFEIVAELEAMHDE